MTGGDVYADIADMYDTYVQAEMDIPFFRQEAAAAGGPILELMAGTGRVSLALLQAIYPLTCVDASRAMLQRLVVKCRGLKRRPRAVRADIRQLPFRATFALGVVPFNSFMELTDPDDQRRALEEARAALRAGGRFICTLHNPRVRRATLDGTKRLLGRFAAPGRKGALTVWSQGRVESVRGLASSRQTFEVSDANDRVVERRESTVRFALIEPETFAATARTAGFTLEALYGDYDRSSFDEQTSSSMIWVLSAA